MGKVVINFANMSVLAKRVSLPGSMSHIQGTGSKGVSLHQKWHGFTRQDLVVQAESEDEGQAEVQEPSAQQSAAIPDAPDLDPEATVMMTRKQRGLYNAMQRGLSKKRQRAESLQAKAKKLKQPSS